MVGTIFIEIFGLNQEMDRSNTTSNSTAHHFPK